MSKFFFIIIFIIINISVFFLRIVWVIDVIGIKIEFYEDLGIGW